MKINVEEMAKIAEQDIEISPMVENRIQETYKQLENQNKVVNKQYRFVRNVAAAAAVMIALSGTTALAAYAYTNSDFLKSAFGKEGHESRPAEVYQQDTGKGYDVEVTLPANEYVPMDAATINYVEPYIKNINEEVMIGDHKLTILNHVTTGKTGVVSYKLECSKGISLLEADELKNRTKGANFTMKSKGFFNIEEDSDGFVYDRLFIDTKKSTDTCYYLYQSYISKNDGADLNIHIEEFDMSYDDEEKYNTERKLINEKRIDIKPDKIINDTIELKNGENTVFEVSSMGLSVNMTYLDQFKKHLEKNDYIDIYNLKDVVIHYNDGSKYVVFDDNANIDNTNALYGSQDNTVRMAFNRIIDTSKIEKITAGKDTIKVTK